MLGDPSLQRTFAQHAGRRAAGTPVPAVLLGSDVTSAWMASAGERGVVRSTALSTDEVANAYLASSAVREPLAAALMARVAVVRASTSDHALVERTAFERDVWLAASRDALIAAGDLDAQLLLGPVLAAEAPASPLRAIAACVRVLGRESPALLVALPSTDAAVRIAIELAEAAPALPLAITTTAEAWKEWLRTARREHAQAMVRPYVVELAPAPAVEVASARATVERASKPTAKKEDDDRARSAAERLLFDALEAAPPSRGLFALNRCLDVSFGNRPIEIDLACTSRRLAIEVDGYFHFRDHDAYRRDRRKDVLLQKEGYLVMRFLAEDVVGGLEDVVATIHATLEERKA